MLLTHYLSVRDVIVRYLVLDSREMDTKRKNLDTIGAPQVLNSYYV